MSLDVYLELNAPSAKSGSGIFIRENGATREITRAEWDARFPGAEPVVAVGGDSEDAAVYSRNITHNLTDMADAAGVYKHLWRPDEIGITRAVELIDPLTEGLEKLRADPGKFRSLNPPNGWGDYDGLVAFVADYLAACRKFPHAAVRVSR